MIKWDDKYSTSIDSIDRQHRLLFEFFNDFEESVNEGRGSIYLEKSFHFLESYAKAHFKYEEGCMEEHQCPCAQKNKDAHLKFMQAVTDYKSRFIPGKSPQEFYLEMHKFLEDWITSHIINIDGQLKNCI